MFNKIIENFNNLDKTTKLIINNGLKFCCLIGFISLIILVTYNYSFTTPILFYIGFIMFRLSLIFGVEFIICGFIADKIKSQLI